MEIGVASWGGNETQQIEKTGKEENGAPYMMKMRTG
jgi:hypothetical protein